MNITVNGNKTHTHQKISKKNNKIYPKGKSKIKERAKLWPKTSLSTENEQITHPITTLDSGSILRVTI